MRRKCLWVTVAAAAMLLVPTLRAGTLDTDIIGLFPRGIGEFAYVDMKSARQYKWFPQLEIEILPPFFRQFEGFMRAAGINLNAQVEALAFGAIEESASTPEEMMGVALGEFQPDTMASNMKRLKVPTIQLRGYTLYTFGSSSNSYDLFCFFLDPNTLVFGQREAIEKMLGVYMDSAPSLLANDTIFPLIDQVNGRGLMWAVLDRHYTQLGLQQMLPEVEAGAQNTPLFGKIRAMTFRVDAFFGVEIHFESVCVTRVASNDLGALLQAGILYRRFEVRESNPDLARMLDQAQVVRHGDRLDLDLNVSKERLMALIKEQIFAMKK